MMRPFSNLVAGLSLAALAFGAADGQLSSEERAALNRISGRSMQGNLSFLASDSLEGRGTPSRGLDLAAEYIAAQFRRAGLESVDPKGTYFQTADFVSIGDFKDARLTLRTAGQEVVLNEGELESNGAVTVDLKDAEAVRLPSADIAGKVVIGDSRIFARGEQLAGLRASKPRLIILVIGRKKQAFFAQQIVAEESIGDVPVLAAYGAKALDLLRGKEPLQVSAHLAKPEVTKIHPRNVAGILRGSDPALRDQFIVVSAHYDHMGMRPEGTGDRIFNGANDNGSGTVSVMEIASALASAPVRPKRSFLFITFFGEEEGLLGAYYYTKHPLVPLAKTIVNINLEQMGRTDDQEGKRISEFAFTGPSYSDVPDVMAEAAKSFDVRVYHKPDADAFFARSDNFAFAKAGVIDHTVVVGFEFPDYHAVGDEWEKIDYNNMEKVDRAIGAGLIRLADQPDAPQWKDVSATEPYRKAARQ